MELSVDLIEITRIPYHELETVYLSANLAVVPHGHHVQTKISNGNKSVKFTPHRFSFIVDPIPSNSESSLIITIFTHLTNKHKLAISYVSIPIKSIPLHSISSASLSTTLLTSFSVSPIVTISLGLNVNNMNINPPHLKNLPHNQLHHPSSVSGIDYTLCEDAPKIEFDNFGRLKPPKHYIDKCAKLVEENSDFFLNLILNDSLRQYVLNKVANHYQANDCVSISNISSGGQQQQASNIAKQSASSKKPKKSQTKHAKGYDHTPQPPNEPPNPRRQIRNDDSSDIPIIDNNLMSNQQSQLQQQQQQQQQAHLPQQNSYANSEINNETHPIKSQVWTVSISKKQQYAQQKQNPNQQQFPYPPQQQQPQNPQIHHNSQVPQISQISQNIQKNESPPKSFVHSVPVDQKKSLRTKTQPLADIEIQKPFFKKKGGEHDKVTVRGLLQPKTGSATDDKSSINQANKKNRSICVAPKQKQKFQNQEDNHSYSNSSNDMSEVSPTGSSSSSFSKSDVQQRKTSPSISYSSISASQSQNNPNVSGGGPPSHDHRTQFMMKPKPPPQIQNPMTASQQPIDNGVSPRRPR